MLISPSQGKAFDSEEGAFEHIRAFVETYQIDCSQLLKPNIADYKTFNEVFPGQLVLSKRRLTSSATQFFYRELRPGARPIDAPNDPKVISSAADCRLTVFQSVDLAKEFWIKVSRYTEDPLSHH